MQSNSVSSAFYNCSCVNSGQLQTSEPSIDGVWNHILAYALYLRLLPIALAFLGKYESNTAKYSIGAKAVLYGLGVTVVYTALGVSAASSGRVFSSIEVLPGFGVASEAVYVIMGPSLLGLLRVKL